MNQSKRDNYNKRLIHALLVNIYKQLLSNFKQKSNKRHLRADGLSLLPSALRPCLLGDQIDRILVIGKVGLAKHFSLLRTLNSSKAVSISVLAVFGLGFSLFIQNSYVSNASAASLTLSIPSTPLSLDISPLKETNFEKSTAGQISVTTDSASGYTLSIKSKNSENFDKLINSSGSGNSGNSNNMLNSISSALSETDYQNTGALNTWAWLPSKLNGELNSNFQPSPKNSEETIIEATEESNSEANNYDITLAAKTDQTITTGSYTNTFVITAIANLPKIAGIMQNWYNCDTLGEEEVITLEDSRDGNTYKVAKLKDGKCWMVENLRLGGSNPIPLTPDDSDVSDNSFTLPASNTSGFSSYDVANVYVPTADSGNVKKEYGGYYTWYAATAGTGSSSMSYGQEASSSICPKGWRLPRGDSNGEFQALYDQYNSADLMLNGAPHFLLAGYYYSGSPVDPGSSGYYWSSTSGGDYYGDYRADNLVLNSSSVYPATNYHQDNGFPVRCVAKEKEKTMQTIDEWGSELVEEQPVEAVDERDGNKYKVAKLQDGKIWMVENLRLGGSSSIQLTSADSDVSSNFTLPASSTSGFSSYNAANVYVPTADSGSVKKEYGGYYTWNVATAGTGTASLSNNQIATSSICPKGWRLPTSNVSNSDFQLLYNQYKNASLMLNGAPHFLLAGNYSSSSPASQGSYGYYWSSTAYGNLNGYYDAYYLYLNSSSVNPAGIGTQNLGFPVRCVAKQSLTITYDGGEEISCWPVNIPNNQHVKNSEKTVVLDSASPHRCGYVFKGWCTVEPTNNLSSSASCSGQTYQPGESMSLSDTNNLTLHAIWGDPYRCLESCSTGAE